MEKTTNIQDIQNTAITLLEIPIRKKDIGNFGIVYHPFFNCTVVAYDGELIDILTDKENFKKYIKDLKKYIKKETNIFKIIMLINKPYRMFFLSLIKNYLDEKNFAIFLKECYTETEFPNRDVNVSVEQIKNMFNIANKNLLMDTEEKEIFDNLNDEITIYRGFYSDEFYNALSWTLDLNVANFFATRFKNEGGCIYQANIKKSDIFTYINSRNEKEIIVDYTKLYNIKKVQKKS